jgi:hypothetical protein
MSLWVSTVAKSNAGKYFSSNGGRMVSVVHIVATQRTANSNQETFISVIVVIIRHR